MSVSSSAYAASYKSLNDEQRQAVDLVDGPVLVIAGPGTGKTQLLATRVGRILETTDTSPENILCLTFSESAVASMKSRLNNLIGRSASEITVSTYHGFGRTLIATYPEKFSSEVLAAKPADDLLIDKLYRQILNDLPYSNPLKNDFYLNDTKTLISNYKRALIKPDDLEAVIKSNQEFMTAANKLLEKIFPTSFRLSKSNAKLFAELLKKSKQLPGTISIKSVLPLKDLWVEQLESAVDTFKAQNNTPPLRQWKDSWLEKDDLGRFRLISPDLISKQTALIEVYRIYNKLLKQNALFDYDDMILLAIQGLRDNPDLKQTLQERYQYIQLDEFQDTNESQLKLVELLADHPIYEGRPNILAVGDDDQAIYSFQGAHYSHMKRFISSYKDVKLINLKQNYRSTEDIISLSGNIRDQIIDTIDIKLDKGQVSAISKDINGQVMRVELEKDIEQLAWVSDYIKGLLKQPGSKAEEIAVFAPKHQMLIDLIPFLHANQIPINYEQKNNILDDYIINQLITAAKLVVNLRNKSEADTYWPQVLSFNYWQIPTSLIWQLSIKAHEDKTAWIDVLLKHPKTKPIALFFIRLNQLSEDSSYELMLSYLMGNLTLPLNEKDLADFTSPFYEYYFNNLNTNSRSFNADAWRLIGQLSILRSKANEYSETNLNLDGFIDFFESYKKANLKIIDSSPFRESEDAVNLMTAHASKGLEFNTVIIINTIDSAWGRSSRRRSNSLGLPANLSFVKVNENNDSEKLRLFFVAVSRARHNLVLASYNQSLSGKYSDPLTYLSEQVKEDQLISPLLPEKYQTVIKAKSTSQNLALDQPTWWSRHLDSFDPDKHAVLKNRLDNFYLTATNLNTFTNVNEDGPSLFFIKEIVRFPSPQSESAEYGSAMHHTLDWIFKQTREDLGKVPERKQILNQFELLLSKRHINKHDFEQLLIRGTNALNAYLNQVDLSINKDDQSEYGFSPTFKTVRLKGTIDRLIIDPKEKTIKIVDFKTGKSYSKWNKSDTKILHHRNQLYFYKLLVELSPKFKGYKVNTGVIQFVEPDILDGKIKSIELSYNDNELEKTKQLIEVVWNKIMHLDFPNVNQYPKSTKGIASFEQDLIKGEI